jgi:tetratricopeptide (TPR) repeat protein
MNRVARALGLALTLAAAAVGAREVWVRHQITQAQTLLDDGDVPGAVARLRNAAARRPSTASVQLRLAGALSIEARATAAADRQEHLMGEAEAAYERAIALERSNPTLLNDATVGLRTLGKTERAIVLFKEAAALAPAWGGPDVNLAETYREFARYDEALSVLRALETRSIDVPIVRVKNALAQVHMDANAPQRAEEVLRSVVPQHPDYAPARVTLALALFEQRRYAEATTELEEALRVDSKAGSLLFLCQVYALQKRADETLMCARRAVRAGTPLDAIRRDPLFAFLGDRLSTEVNDKLP